MKKINRWIPAIVGVIVMIFGGLVYAWTVLSAPIAAMYPEWTKAQLSATFTIMMFCFCIGCVAVGFFIKKLSSRVMLIISAFLFLAGLFIAGKASSLFILYLGFGILAGLGSGVTYNTVMSTIVKWFPDKTGFISGILLMGYGIGSFIIGKIYTSFTPSDGGPQWRSSFLILSLFIAVLIAISAIFIVDPPIDYVVFAGKNKHHSGYYAYEELNTAQMLKRSSFWFYFIFAVIFSAAGLAIVSQGTPIAMEAMQITQQSATASQMNYIATIVGLISIFNGVGRIVFGFLYDRIGRLWTMLIGCIVLISAMLLMFWALTGYSKVILVLSFIVTGLGYGCLTPCNSAFISTFYGMKHYPANFSIINLILLVSSFSSTIAGAVYDTTGSYVTIIIIVIAMLVIGIVLSCLIRKPKQSTPIKTCV